MLKFLEFCPDLLEKCIGQTLLIHIIKIENINKNGDDIKINKIDEIKSNNLFINILYCKYYSVILYLIFF